VPGVTPSRVAALEILRRTRAGELADRALDAITASLQPRDRAWVQELVYGTLRLRGRLDYQLNQLARGGIESLEPDVLDVLRLGAYQLQEMGSVPAYAAISQSQELARAVGAARAVGLIGGVLHALQRRARAIRFPAPEHDPVEHLARWGSHPRWLVERWIRRWGVGGATALVEANNQRPELYLRPLGIGLTEAARRLETRGIPAEPVPFAASALRVLPPTTAVEALRVVPAVVQDPAAGLVVDYAAVPEGARVLDLCAAPGGKALALAEVAAVVAADLSIRRLARVRENAARLGWAGRILLVAADGRAPPFRAASADLVLLDAPCTGTGTFRRHPDSRWRLQPEHLLELTALQRELLRSAAALVRDGGWLVYATCSLEEEENELQVDEFLKQNPMWRPEPPTIALPEAMLDEAGRLVVMPSRWGVDGAFAARLRREG
jgi:16S rRNA (cytosine967-C5)-methyltransferase